jgi:hypothetical protein
MSSETCSLAAYSNNTNNKLLLTLPCYQYWLLCCFYVWILKLSFLPFISADFNIFTSSNQSWILISYENDLNSLCIMYLVDFNDIQFVLVLCMHVVLLLFHFIYSIIPNFCLIACIKTNFFTCIFIQIWNKCYYIIKFRSY